MDKETPKRPSNIRIRTLKSDIEEMRNSGGQVMAGGIIGKPLEEVEKSSPKKVIDKVDPLFESDKKVLNKDSNKKSKILPIMIGIVMIFILGGVSAYLIFKPKGDQEIVATPTVKPTPSHISLLANPVEEKINIEFSGELSDFEKILSQEYKKNYEPGSSLELVLLKDEINSFPANDFLNVIFSGFPGVISTDVPSFKEDFSLLIYNSGQAVQNRLASVYEIDKGDFPSFTIANLKSKFSTALEKLIEERPDLLSSQYLENVGQTKSPFLSQEIGPVKARYIQFSAGSKFYYGWYQDYLLMATSNESFSRLLTAILPGI